MAPLLTPGWACAVHRAICLPRADFPVMLREAQTQEGRGFGGDPSTGAGPRPQDRALGLALSLISLSNGATTQMSSSGETQHSTRKKHL